MKVDTALVGSGDEIDICSLVREDNEDSKAKDHCDADVVHEAIDKSSLLVLSIWVKLVNEVNPDR